MEAFDDISQLVGSAALSSTYGGVVDPEQPKKRAANRSLSVDAELLLTLMKLGHNFPELDLAQRFSISQSTVSQIFLPGCFVYTIRLRRSTSGNLRH